mgnify:CR=1 FL=1
MERLLCWLLGHLGGRQERIAEYRCGTTDSYFECDRCGKWSASPLR